MVSVRARGKIDGVTEDHGREKKTLQGTTDAFMTLRSILTFNVILNLMPSNDVS